MIGIVDELTLMSLASPITVLATITAGEKMPNLALLPIDICPPRLLLRTIVLGLFIVKQVALINIINTTTNTTSDDDDIVVTIIVGIYTTVSAADTVIDSNDNGIS